MNPYKCTNCEIIIKCTNCETEYEENEISITECLNCNTDEYLMEIE